MLVISDPEQLRVAVKKIKQQGKEIAFVATMGNLHSGHITLVEAGFKKAQAVVASIFVNPMQFNNATDLANYPKTLEADCAALEKSGVDIVFTPTAETIYPNGLATQTYVEVPAIANILEGKLRPGHFRGVSTIVNKLFNLVQPDYACFGRKDFQQLILIEQMVADLAMPIKIIPVDIVRAESGLALSSRNSNLNDEELLLAPTLNKVMQQLTLDVKNKVATPLQLIEEATNTLNKAGFKTDEIHIVDTSTLLALTDESKEAAILMAAFLRTTRLIDNQITAL